MDCGTANALPRESVELFDCGMQEELDKAFELYRGSCPCCVWIAVRVRSNDQACPGRTRRGNAHVRPPRLQLAGSELEGTLNLIQDALRSRPHLGDTHALSRK